MQMCMANIVTTRAITTRVTTNCVVRNLLFRLCVPIVLMFAGAGCFSDRIVTSVYVKDYGCTITTRFRYKLLSSPDLKSTAERLYPNVFASSGIPVLINENGTYFKGREIGYWDDTNGLSLLAYFASLGTLPTIFSHDEDRIVIIENIGVDKIDKRINMNFDYKGTFTFFPPLGMVCLRPDGSEAVKNGRAFVSSGLAKNSVRDSSNAKLMEAISYGIASRLKEMEDSGQIDESIFKRMREAEAAERARQLKMAAENAERERKAKAEAARRAREKAAEAERLRVQAGTQEETHRIHDKPANKQPYRITSCTREEGSDFIYKFALELTGEVADPLQAFLDIKQKLRAYVRDMYAGANDVRDISSIRVDFRDEAIAGNNISGRAMVLTITPAALVYDANTCRGKLSVRFNANQYEEARAWVRRNIETLARDKNIALVTGEIPPNARFYSLGESLKDGNILEIEFKTE